MKVSYKKGFDEDVSNRLQKPPHKVVENEPVIGFTIVTVQSKIHRHVEAVFQGIGIIIIIC